MFVGGGSACGFRRNLPARTLVANVRSCQYQTFEFAPANLAVSVHHRAHQPRLIVSTRAIHSLLVNGLAPIDQHSRGRRIDIVAQAVFCKSHRRGCAEFVCRGLFEQVSTKTLPCRRGYSWAAALPPLEAEPRIGRWPLDPPLNRHLAAGTGECSMLGCVVPSSCTTRARVWAALACSITFGPAASTRSEKMANSPLTISATVAPSNPRLIRMFWLCARLCIRRVSA